MRWHLAGPQSSLASARTDFREPESDVPPVWNHWSPRLEKNIGYVWVPIGLAAPGNVLDVTTPRGMVQGQNVALPFHDPQKDIPKT